MGASNERAASDVRLGFEQVGQGNIERGLNNILAGQSNLLTAGAHERAKFGFQGETMIKQNDAKDKEQQAQDAIDFANATEAMRKDKIITGLNEAVKLRKKTPGRSQTLLTSLNTPTENNTNSLLTQTTGNKQ